MEKNQNYALKNDISDKQIELKKYPELPLEELKTRHENRIRNSQQMNNLQQIVNTFENSKTNTYPLNPNAFWKTTTPELQLLNTFTNSSKSETQLITVKNNESDAIFIEMDELINSINNQLIEELEYDVLIDETYKVISDLIDLTNNK